MEKKKKKEETIVEKATNLFNDIHGDDDDDADPPECRRGTSLQLIVWDLANRDAAACKMGKLV